MNDLLRLKQIAEIKKKILKCLDGIGTNKVTFGELFNKYKNYFSEDILKKYIGICFDEGFIDIDAGLLKNKAQIKSSINRNTILQITSEGQYYAYNKKQIETEISFTPFKWFNYRKRYKLR